MRESVLTGISWIKSNMNLISPNFKFSNYDFHVHVPEAATPKDGPSAGITICCSLVSLITGYILRNDTAMTGELSLTGFVLPVGGIKEKVLGAFRMGIKRFILSYKNKVDVEEAFENDVILKEVK
jgi:ATP-dependent Lon protease